MSYRRSEYGCLGLDTEARITANAVQVDDGGDITSGAVADTRTINQTYLVVNEGDGVGGNEKFDIQLSFTGLTGNPVTVEMVGRYQGNAGHNVKLFIWNFTGTPAWEEVTADSGDFGSSTTDSSYLFDLMQIPTLTDISDYLSGGEVRLRIYHESAPSNSHNFYLDYIDIVQETLHLTTPGIPTILTGQDELQAANTTLDGANGTITLLTDGDYEHLSTISFQASSGADVKLSLYCNGAKVVTLWERRVSSAGDIGSASSTAIRAFSAGDVIDWRFESDIPDTTISIIAMRNRLIKAS